MSDGFFENGPREFLVKEAPVLARALRDTIYWKRVIGVSGEPSSQRLGDRRIIRRVRITILGALEPVASAIQQVLPADWVLTSQEYDAEAREMDIEFAETVKR